MPVLAGRAKDMSSLSSSPAVQHSLGVQMLLQSVGRSCQESLCIFSDILKRHRYSGVSPLR